MSAPSTAVSRPAEKRPPQRLARWPTPVRALVVGTLIARSAGFGYPFLAYRLSGIGYSPATAGIVLALFGVGWLIGQLCAGWSTDRFGYRSTLSGTVILGAATLPLLAAGTGLAWLLLAAGLAGFAYDAPRPAVSAALTDLVVEPQRRALISGWRLAAINVGAAITGGLGGLLADRVGYLALCLANAGSFIAFGLVAVPALPRQPQRHRGNAHSTQASRTALRDRRLWLLCASSMSAMTCAVGLMSALPLMMAHDGLSAESYGWTQIVDAVAVLALTPLLNPVLSRRAGKPGPLMRAQALSSLTLGVGMGSAGFAHTTVAYSTAVAVSVPGEIALYIVATEVVTLIAPPHAIGTYHGAFGSTFASSVIAAPLLAGGAMALGGNRLAGLAVVACGLLATLLCLPLAAALRAPGRPAAAGDAAAASPSVRGDGQPSSSADPTLLRTPDASY